MPIGLDLFSKFDVDVLDHDILLMFGVECHRELKCISNECSNTFTHLPSGTTIPVTFLGETKVPDNTYLSNGLLTMLY